MRRVRTIQYPALTAPVLTTAQFKETVTESRWHQPLTEPVRLKTLPLAVIVASGLFQPVLTTAQFKEAVTEDRWHQPLSEPVRLKTLPVSVTASGSFHVSFVEPVTESRWHQPLTEPVRLKTLPIAVTVASGPVWAPFVPAVTLDRYHQPLAIPVRRIVPTAVAAPSSFWSGVTPTAETVTLDKYYAPLANPTLRGGLSVTEQPSLAFVKAAPFAEAVSIDKWLQPLSQPWASRRLPRAVEFPALFYSYAIIGNAAVTVWDPAHKSASITLGRAETCAVTNASSGTWKSVRATTSKSTGKLYLEFVHGLRDGNGTIIGFGNSSINTANYSGSDGNSFGYQVEGSVWGLAGSWQGTTKMGECVQVAIDLDAKLVWARTERSTNWNNSGLADPAAGVGGKSYTVAGALFPVWSGIGAAGNTDQNGCTINAGGFTFVGTAPSGFSAWDSSTPTLAGIAGTRPTVWDSGNKNANVTLSGSDLVATQNGLTGNWCGVRGTSSYGGGKVYFEAAITAVDGISGWEIGLQDAATSFADHTGPGSDPHSVAFRDGTNDIYWGNLSNQGSLLWDGGVAGDVIGVAIDFNRGVAWAKNVTTGSNWNNDATSSPVTGKRGQWIGSHDVMFIGWAGIRFGGVADVVTLNAGANPFVGTLPTGFIAWDETGAGNHNRGFHVNIGRFMNT